MSLEVKQSEVVVADVAAERVFTTLGIAFEAIGSGLAGAKQLLVEQTADIPLLRDFESMDRTLNRAAENQIGRMQAALSKPDLALRLPRNVLSDYSRAAGSLAAMKCLLPIALAAQQLDASRLAHGIGQLQAAKQALSAADFNRAGHASREAAQTLGEVLAEARQKVQGAQRDVLAEAMEATLLSRQFKVDRHDQGDGGILWLAHKGATTISVAFDARGKVAMDFRGFMGGSCEMEKDELFKELRRRGVHLHSVQIRRKRPPLPRIPDAGESQRQNTSEPQVARKRKQKNLSV